MRGWEGMATPGPGRPATHTDPDCPHLSKVTGRVREIDDAEAHVESIPSAYLCKWCTGEQSDGDGNRGGTCPLCGDHYVGDLPRHLPCRGARALEVGP